MDAALRGGFMREKGIAATLLPHCHWMMTRGPEGSFMRLKINCLLDPSLMAISPPYGAKNVLLGAAVEGPGGKWIPCATAVPSGVYYPGLFQVGAGQKQVCVANLRTHQADVALSHAIELAKLSAA